MTDLYFPTYRLLQSLRRFANTVPIPANSTNNTLAFPLDNFALLLRDVNPESFSGESFNVNLGPVEEAIRNSSGITKEALVTMMDPLPNATASVKLPQSLFDGNTTYVLPSQRIVYSVFLTNALFLTLDTNCENSAIGSIILGVDVNSSVTNISMSTGEIQLAYQQFRMVCKKMDTIRVSNKPYDSAQVDPGRGHGGPMHALSPSLELSKCILRIWEIISRGVSTTHLAHVGTLTQRISLYESLLHVLQTESTQICSSQETVLWQCLKYNG